MKRQIGTTLWLVTLLLACGEDFDTLTGPRSVAVSECPPSGSDAYPTPIMDGGGLYGNGSNDAPPAHYSAGLAAASQVPASGAVMVSLGQSITRMPFAEWQEIAETDAIMVNGACGGCTVSAWLPGAVNRLGRKGWVNSFDSLAARGLSREDVDVVWMSVTKTQTEAATTAELETILDLVDEAYPNVKQVFVFNRTYGGYRTDGSAEPGAWQDGVAVKGLVLNHLGETEPWIGWAGDVWANGDAPRSDGLTWTRADFKDDGLHYSPVIGTAKVGALVEAQFEANPFTAWYQP